MVLHPGQPTRSDDDHRHPIFPALIGTILFPVVMNDPDADRRRRIAVILPSDGYRATAFMDAATALGAEVVVATDQAPPMAAGMEDRLVVVDLDRPEESAELIAATAERRRVDSVVGVDDQGVLMAARANEILGLSGNPADAVAATRDKSQMRSIFRSWSIPQPAYRVAGPDSDVESLALAVGLPCVVKPVSLSASTGVIRVDEASRVPAVAARVRDIVVAHGRPSDEPLLVEAFVPGTEVSVEALMVDGDLQVLAFFDKPDPLDGPYFEETIYLTPTRLPPALQHRITVIVADGCRALGLHHGPVHAEVRLTVPDERTRSGDTVPPTTSNESDTPTDDVMIRVLEIAARSIGGMCSRVLEFGSGISLEEVILRNAMALGTDGLQRSAGASGVMMIPIPHSGTLEHVDGIDDALEIDGVIGVEITASIGRRIEALPEGGRYLGFIFAGGPTPDDVESSLRSAHGLLRIRIVDGDEPPADGGPPRRTGRTEPVPSVTGVVIGSHDDHHDRASTDLGGHP